jgi:thiamine-monophosphate kinase
MGEFDLIERYFKRPAQRSASDQAPSAVSGLSPGVPPAVALGIGDDCALLQPRPGTQLAISSDMLVEGRHFFPDVDPAHLGHKALAVNLSDLAACGAKPLAFTLALALPRADEPWLAAFSRGLFALAEAHGCTLMGGDTTQGPLNICITVFGEVPVVAGKSQALLRSGARAGDDLYVSGTLGDARLALEALRGTLQLPADVLAQARQRLEQPTPRVALGMALRGIATAAIDVSDGLLGDLRHVLQASYCGATIDTSIAIQLIAAHARESWPAARFGTELTLQNRLNWILAGGDDYELLFTAPAAARAAVLEAARASATPVTRIGRIESEAGLRLVDGDGQPVIGQFASFDHFA